MFYLYMATNKITHLSYVGVSHDPIGRIETHLACHDDYYFQRAIKKHGVNAFVWEILDYTTSRKEAFILECEWISKLNTFNNGYNMTEGGENPPNHTGWKRSEKTKSNMSEAQKQRIRTDKHRTISICNLGDGMLGKKHSDETRIKMSEAQKGLPGKIPSIATRKKMSDARKGKTMPPRSEEWKEKQRASKIGIKWSNNRRVAQNNRSINHGVD